MKVIVTLEKLFATTVWNADLPKLGPVANRFPFQLAEIDGGSGLDYNVRLGEFAENAIGDGVKFVGAGADTRDAESSIGRSTGPELIVLGVVLPRVATIRRIGISETDEEIRQRVRLGVLNDKLPRNGRALLFWRVIGSVNPGIWPLRRLFRRLRQRIAVHGVRIDGGVQVDKDRADDFGPLLSFCQRKVRSAVVSTAPVIEQRRIAAVVIV